MQFTDDVVAEVVSCWEETLMAKEEQALVSGELIGQGLVMGVSLDDLAAFTCGEELL